MLESANPGDPPHRHERLVSVPVPIPQPHRTATWSCACGAIELDTYPVGPHGIEDGSLPVGVAWVAPLQIDAAARLPSVDPTARRSQLG
jgi:hypothetical protein